MGFSTNQKAPCSWTVVRAASMLPKAVRTMTGGAPAISFRRRNSSIPSMPGIMTSVTGVGFEQREFVESFLTVGSRLGNEAPTFHHARDGRPLVGFVIDDQHASSPLRI